MVVECAFIFPNPKSVFKIRKLMLTSVGEKSPPVVFMEAVVETSQVGSSFLAIRNGLEVPSIPLPLQELKGKGQSAVA